uniref:'chromo' domain containing protein n=1 Tax=Solanum tuberosum TaxID=4113 RepID=M1DAY5_SOLTU
MSALFGDVMLPPDSSRAAGKRYCSDCTFDDDEEYKLKKEERQQTQAPRQTKSGRNLEREESCFLGDSSFVGGVTIRHTNWDQMSRTDKQIGTGVTIRHTNRDRLPRTGINFGSGITIGHNNLERVP